ncbi:hypothetical protein J6590_013607 [Homalodisca vitripennis]|nr:hypothetical protein J6590_013607 [Homalodisca vitripennis]
MQANPLVDGHIPSLNKHHILPIDLLIEYSSATEPAIRLTASLLIHDQQWLVQSNVPSLKNTRAFLLQWSFQSSVPSLTNTTALLLVHLPIDTLMEYSSATEPTKRKPPIYWYVISSGRSSPASFLNKYYSPPAGNICL